MHLELSFLIPPCANCYAYTFQRIIVSNKVQVLPFIFSVSLNALLDIQPLHIDAFLTFSWTCLLNIHAKNILLLQTPCCKLDTKPSLLSILSWYDWKAVLLSCAETLPNSIYHTQILGNRKLHALRVQVKFSKRFHHFFCFQDNIYEGTHKNQYNFWELCWYPIKSVLSLDN